MAQHKRDRLRGSSFETSLEFFFLLTANSRLLLFDHDNITCHSRLCEVVSDDRDDEKLAESIWRASL